MSIFFKKTLLSFFIVGLMSCAGTIKTTSNAILEDALFKRAYIVSQETSQFIKFKFGIITPLGYYVRPDNAPIRREKIGNTAIIIKEELAKHGIEATIGKKGDEPTEFDFIVVYNDTWRWDFKKILDQLEIIFISADGQREIAKSVYNIYPNKEFHNFPSPKKEVPKMIRELIAGIN